MAPVNRGRSLVEYELHGRGQEASVGDLGVVFLVEIVEDGVRAVGVVIEVLEVKLVVFFILRLWVEVNHFFKWFRLNLFVFVRSFAGFCQKWRQIDHLYLWSWLR